MKNRTLGMLIVIAGVLAIFIKPEEYAWIVSAILIVIAVIVVMVIQFIV